MRISAEQFARAGVGGPQHGLVVETGGDDIGNFPPDGDQGIAMRQRLGMAAAGHDDEIRLGDRIDPDRRPGPSGMPVGTEGKKHAAIGETGGRDGNAASARVGGP